MAQVCLRNISKTYSGNVLAVDNVNLGIENKEFLVLVGPSGCGKSTILRMIAGLEDPTKGDLYIGDKRVNGVPPKDRNIAMVFQNYALYPHMTVYENMAFALKLRRYSRAEIDQRVKEAAEILGITKHLSKRPKALSGGERQRVAVGRAIVRKPIVFLFDEPLSNLDAKLRGQMRVEISKLHIRLQTTMVYVTHDQVEAMTMGTRIAVMKDGIIHQIADPIALYDRPVNKFVAGFIGSPPMNFMNGIIIKSEGKLFFNEGNFTVKIADEMHDKLKHCCDKEVTMGIRPEDIYDKFFVQYASPENTVSVTCEVVEPMGAEVYLYLSTGKHTFVARVGGHNNPTVNQEMDVVFDMKKAHFFDPKTEKTIL
ncbi:MAG: sn-glycerol-3-phosphate ABC transporter ATP-binding protein UgpC [Candidatus Omnitrophota bacterium]|jgi:multiple sugar transport system ATP-binding protein